MNTLGMIIIGAVLLLILSIIFVFRSRTKRHVSFKLVIEKGVITENNGEVPSEFLYDIQQLARMYKPEKLIINGSGISSIAPKLEFMGTIAPELKVKIEQSLYLSLQ